MIAHVSKRNALGVDGEYRDLCEVMKQFCKMYAPRDLKDQAVDLLHQQKINHLLDQILDLIKKDTKLAQMNRMDQSTFEEHAEKETNKVRERFSTTFFGNDGIVTIASRIPHNMVVNTGKCCSLQCAQQIKDGFEKHLKLKDL